MHAGTKLINISR